MTTIAFDVDNTLIKLNEFNENVPNYPVIMMMQFFKNSGCEIYVWSGSGNDWAERWVEKLGLKDYVKAVVAKGSFVPDVAIDDQEVKLGTVNLKV